MSATANETPTETTRHLDDDKWPCMKCAAEFPALYALTKHMREQHSEPRGLSR